jgi:hypothetical protein
MAMPHLGPGLFAFLGLLVHFGAVEGQFQGAWAGQKKGDMFPVLPNTAEARPASSPLPGSRAPRQTHRRAVAMDNTSARAFHCPFRGLSVAREHPTANRRTGIIIAKRGFSDLGAHLLRRQPLHEHDPGLWQWLAHSRSPCVSPGGR